MRDFTADTSPPSRIRQLASQLVDFFVPPACAGCRRMGARFCSHCLAEVVWITEPICAVCGLESAETNRPCWSCRRHPLCLEHIRAAAHFTGPLRNAIHGLKYRQGFALAAPLGALMVSAWPRWAMAADVVVPIPLHADRQRERGYNQAELLARRFATAVKLPMNHLALIRQRHTRPQADLDGLARLTNMQQAFVADSTHVRRQRVLLVDDVCTTGATLNAAAEALLAAGATSVSAYCLARTQFKRASTS